jgi:hypothetical protein
MELRIGVAVSLTILYGCGPNSEPKAAAVKAAAPDPVEITMFYSAPPHPALGEKAMLCYSVSNADQLTLDPPVDRVWPAYNRCIDIKPTRPVTYTLTASRGPESVSKSVTVAPGPPAVKLLEVTISAISVARGQPVTVCFKARNATRVTIKPGAWMKPFDNEVGCSQDTPSKDTAYVVTATGPGGEESQRVAVKVK